MSQTNKILAASDVKIIDNVEVLINPTANEALALFKQTTSLRILDSKDIYVWDGYSDLLHSGVIVEKHFTSAGKRIILEKTVDRTKKAWLEISPESLYLYGNILCSLEINEGEHNYSDLSNKFKQIFKLKPYKTTTAKAIHQNGVELDSGKKDVITQLFINGPTFDGDICSKSARDDLVDDGYVKHCFGFAWLTTPGIKLALKLDLEKKKDKRQRERSDNSDIANKLRRSNPQLFEQLQKVESRLAIAATIKSDQPYHNPTKQTVLNIIETANKKYPYQPGNFDSQQDALEAVRFILQDNDCWVWLSQGKTHIRMAHILGIDLKQKDTVTGYFAKDGIYPGSYGRAEIREILKNSKYINYLYKDITIKDFADYRRFKQDQLTTLAKNNSEASMANSIDKLFDVFAAKKPTTKKPIKKPDTKKPAKSAPIKKTTTKPAVTPKTKPKSKTEPKVTKLTGSHLLEHHLDLHRQHADKARSNWADYKLHSKHAQVYTDYARNTKNNDAAQNIDKAKSANDKAIFHKSEAQKHYQLRDYHMAEAEKLRAQGVKSLHQGLMPAPKDEDVRKLAPHPSLFANKPKKK